MDILPLLHAATGGRPHAEPPRARLITRREIEVYRVQNARLKALEIDVHARRSDLIDRIKCGAKVEVGPWIPQVAQIEYRSFSAESLTKLLGPAIVAGLKEQLPAGKREMFSVIPREGWFEDDDSDTMHHAG